MPRWAYICQQCWDVLNGDQYFPDEPRGGYFQGCDACGEDLTLSVAVHPDLIEATKAVLVPVPDCTGLPAPKEAHA